MTIIQQGKNVSDDILQILSSFENHSKQPTALELLLQYYQKRPDLFEQFYSVYAGRFEVNLDSPRFGYFTQIAVVKNLCEAVNATPEDMNLLILFVRVAGHFLKLDVLKAEGGRHNTVSILHTDTSYKSACFGIPKDAFVATLSDLSAWRCTN